MRHPLFAAAHILGMASASAVWSADDDCHVRMADWQPRSRVLQLAELNDWQVFRIKTGDGCHQIRARDTRGRAIGVTLDPATLEVVDLEFEGLNVDDDAAGDSSLAEHG